MGSKKTAFPVVGIGASAGGVKALQDFFDHLPSDTEMAFVVVIHLDPDHSSNLDKLLDSSSEMNVLQVNRKTKLEPNCIYVIAPGKHLKIDGHYLIPTDKKKEEHTTIDLFFRSLAEQCREQAIGMILSGAGTDGSMGLKAIKEYGGVAIAQDPDEAEYNGMPQSAVDTGLVDFVLSLKDLGSKVAEYKEALSSVRMPLEPGKLSEKESKALHKVFDKLNAETGHDFSHYKRTTVLRRLQRRMQVTGNFRIAEYYRFIENNRDEVIDLFTDLLISVTNFFRDPEAFKAFEEKVIPKLFEHKEQGDQVRVWVVGCATGEEAYSMAILLNEYASTLDIRPEIKIFATDISKEALQTARQGIYPETITADVSEERIQRFFHKEGQGYRVNKEIREMVLFSFHDLLGNPPFSNLDLITCRNLLIYFNSDLQSEVFKLLHYALQPEAYLFVGLSDSITHSSEFFTSINKQKGIFKSRPFSKSRLQLPEIPIWKNIYYGKTSSSEKSFKKNNVQFDKIHYTLLAHQFAPASVIINDNNEVMHASVGIEKYLRYSEGEPSRNLLDMVLPELRRPLRSLLFQVNDDDGDNQTVNTKAYLKGHDQAIRILIQPVNEPNCPDGFLQVIFRQETSSKQTGEDSSGSGKSNQSAEDKELIQQLEVELDQVKGQLSVMAEEYETSNEELRTSNEELQSMNEELQTTAEELETSKEELQSVNEELRLVNNELENKVEELGQANNDLNNLMEATEVGIIFVDKDLCIKRFTNNTKGLFNLVESDLGRPLSHITNKLRYDKLIADVTQILGDQAKIKKLVSSEDDRWYMMRLRPYLTPRQGTEGVVITFVEVTSLKQAEQALVYQAKQQEAIARLGLYSLNSTKLKLITDKATEVLADVMQADYTAILKFNENDKTLVLKSGSGWSDKTKKNFRQEVNPQWGAGYSLHKQEPLIVEDVKSEDRFRQSQLLSDSNITSMVNIPIKGKSSSYGMLGVYTIEQRSFTDNELNFLQTTANLLAEITERILAEKECTKANKQLKKALKLRDEFLSIASHELQTPITSAKTQIELFEQELIDANNEEYAGKIHKINESIDRLTGLIRKLLDISRMQKGKLALEKEEFSLDKLIEETVESLDPLSGHSIEVQKPEKEVSGYADRFRIGQVLTNLIENAMKYSPESARILIHYKQNADRILVSVKDFGDGISASDKQRIFKRFFKGGGSKQTYPGFGIGLYICKQIVQGHGGEIWVEENDGKGSVFTFDLPVRADEDN